MPVVATTDKEPSPEPCASEPCLEGIPIGWQPAKEIQPVAEAASADAREVPNPRKRRRSHNPRGPPDAVVADAWRFRLRSDEGSKVRHS